MSIETLFMHQSWPIDMLFIVQGRIKWFEKSLIKNDVVYKTLLGIIWHSWSKLLKTYSDSIFYLRSKPRLVMYTDMIQLKIWCLLTVSLYLDKSLSTDVIYITWNWNMFRTSSSIKSFKWSGFHWSPFSDFKLIQKFYTVFQLQALAILNKVSVENRIYWCSLRRDCLLPRKRSCEQPIFHIFVSRLRLHAHCYWIN